MNKPFYREESVVYQCRSSSGMTLEAKPVSCVWVMAVAVLIAVAIVIFLWLGEYTRKSHVEDFLSSDQGRVKGYMFQIDSLIVKDRQKEQLIKKGKLIFVLSVEKSLLELAGLQVLAIKNRSVAPQVKVLDSVSKKMIYYEAI